MSMETRLKVKQLFQISFALNIYIESDSGCGSVGRAVAFDSSGPRFDSSHRQKLN